MTVIFNNYLSIVIPQAGPAESSGVVANRRADGGM